MPGETRLLPAKQQRFQHPGHAILKICWRNAARLGLQGWACVAHGDTDGCLIKHTKIVFTVANDHNLFTGQPAGITHGPHRALFIGILGYNLNIVFPRRQGLDARNAIEHGSQRRDFGHFSHTHKELVDAQ